MNQKQDERLSPMKYHGENKGVTEEFIKNSDEEEVRNLICEIFSETRVNI